MEASNSPLRIFIGFDPRQVVSYTALCTSLIRHSSKPLAITPLVIETLPLERRGLTPFTFSRFLVPYLCGYEGRALFLDADIMARADVSELFEIAQGSPSVWVSKNRLKFEWASVMLFNNERCAVLTPDYVQKTENPLMLSWAEEVGDLPPEWNHLVGYDAPNPDAKMVHFTQGVPAFPETADSEHADEWLATVNASRSAQPWVTLMGNSVHAEPVIERLRNAGRAA